jgi:phosphotransferase system enzyme I (PtsI)
MGSSFLVFAANPVYNEPARMGWNAKDHQAMGGTMENQDMGHERLGMEVCLKGVPISPGVAVARVCLFNDGRHNVITPSLIDPSDVEAQVGRLGDALATVVTLLDELKGKVAREVGPAEAEIFSAQKMMIEDPGIQSKMMAAIRDDKMGCEMAVMRVLDAYEARIKALDNQYLRERSSDIGELKRRLLDVLAETHPGLQCEGLGGCLHGRGRVVVAVELTPSLAIDLEAAHIRGFVTEHGGVTSHAAILARALGIPAVSGIPGIAGMITCGTELLVDGDAGEIILWPEPATVDQARRRSGGGRSVVAEDPVPALRVMANISVAAEAVEAVGMKAEGIGLYRSEFEFMAAGKILNEDEQFERYAAVVKTMAGLPVFLRLLDIGGEKQVPGLVITKEVNPALGFRGARLLLQRPDLVATQARAIARASVFGPIHVTYPMITDVDQFLQLRRLFEEAVAGLPAGVLRHGVMFEVPSACIEAREVLREADYGCIGTNDLFQYLLALDRNNELVVGDFRPDHTAFWTLLKQMVAAAAEAGKPLSVCGEMAGWPEYVVHLAKVGITTVSVSTRLISVARKAMR